jgi:hypothetical protein
VVEARRLVVREEGRRQQGLGISDGSAKTGSIKTGGKINDGGSPAMRTRKKLFQVSTEAGKRKR